LGLGHLEHGGIAIHACDVSRSSNLGCSETGHDPHPTGDIQYVGSRLQGYACQQVRRPWGKQGRDQVTLIGGESRATELPALVLIHQVCLAHDDFSLSFALHPDLTPTLLILAVTCPETAGQMRGGFRCILCCHVTRRRGVWQEQVSIAGLLCAPHTSRMHHRITVTSRPMRFAGPSYACVRTNCWRRCSPDVVTGYLGGRSGL
jgi:hypothetical protein